MKYLKRSAGYIVLIIALLFLQAYCDLSLPNYTSNIINVGIQQNGIEDSVPEKIRKTSMDSLKLFMEEDDAATLDERNTTHTAAIMVTSAISTMRIPVDFI